MIEKLSSLQDKTLQWFDSLFSVEAEKNTPWFGRIYFAGLFLAGLYLWSKFLSWNELTIDYYDWAIINVPRLAFLQNALRLGQFPLHMAGTESLHGLTDRFFTIPDVITTPQILLLKFVDIPTFVLTDIFIHYLIGTLGLIWIRRRFQLSLFAFSVLFFLFMFNGHILAHYSVGHLTWDAYFMFPILFMYIFRFLDGEQGWRWVGGFSLSMFYMVLAGGQHHFTWMLIFMGVLMLFCWRRSLWLLAAGLFSGLLSAVRLLPPSLEVQTFRDYRVFEIVLGYPSLAEVFESMVFLRRPVPVEPEYIQYNLWFYEKLYWEFDIYLGILGTAFLVTFGLYLWWKNPVPQYWETIIPSLVIVILSIGSTYWLLRLSDIPLFGSERITARMISLPLVLFLIMAAVNFQTWLNQYQSVRWYRLMFLGLLGVLIIDLYNHLRIWRLRESALRSGPSPLDPSGSLLANHSDPAYTTVLLAGLAITLLTALFLAFMSARESKMAKDTTSKL